MLKLAGESHIADFFDMMLTHSFYPKITLPTRVNNSSGATLIDKIFCKLSSHTISITSGIILDPLSDYYPYFVSLDNLSAIKANAPKKVKQRLNSPLAMNNMLNYMKLNDISSKLKTDLLQDPNVNYDILHDHLKLTKDIFFSE